MKVFDLTRAMLRLLILNSERDTISEQAKLAALAARDERAKARPRMDALLADLTRLREHTVGRQ